MPNRKHGFGVMAGTEYILIDINTDELLSPGRFKRQGVAEQH